MRLNKSVFSTSRYGGLILCHFFSQRWAWLEYRNKAASYVGHMSLIIGCANAREQTICTKAKGRNKEGINTNRAKLRNGKKKLFIEQGLLDCFDACDAATHIHSMLVYPFDNGVLQQLPAPLISR
jgi:hypothetical protein